MEMGHLRKILKNGYVALLPIIIWNMFLTSKLPPVFSPTSFNAEIPFVILAGENIFRSIIFLLLLFVELGISSPHERKGAVTFFLGIALYFTSWLLLIYAPNSEWSNSVLGFTAPACTPIIWLVGLSLMVKSYYFKLLYSKWHLILPSIAFSIFHVSHTVYVYNRII